MKTANELNFIDPHLFLFAACVLDVRLVLHDIMAGGMMIFLYNIQYINTKYRVYMCICVYLCGGGCSIPCYATHCSCKYLYICIYFATIMSTCHLNNVMYCNWVHGHGHLHSIYATLFDDDYFQSYVTQCILH